MGPFYPPGASRGAFLPHYARRFRSVEIDATWYAVPAARTVEGWERATPDGFVFAAKAPQAITHEKVLRDCEAELDAFLTVMRRLGPKLGPVLFQFPYFKAASFPSLPVFLLRLAPFLRLLPPDLRFAVEIRNKGWLQAPLFDALREHGVALAWIDHPYMPAARQYARLSGALTADFLYVRWLGDRHAIEAETATWDRLVYDRSRELETWAEVMREIGPRVERVHAYANNHYAGCGYETAAQFRELWEG